MQLHIHQKGLKIGRTLRDQITEQVETAFRRLSKRIRAITVYLTDINGSRGGIDKECQIAVQLHRGGTVRVGQTDADLVAAVNVATDRVNHAVTRRLERRRNRTVRTKPWHTDDTDEQTSMQPHDN